MEIGSKTDALTARSKPGVCGQVKALTGSNRLAKCLLAAVMCLMTFAAVAATYVYDSNGRLAIATDAAGASARYHYDKLGNLQRIERLAANQLAVFGFSPSRGAPGVKITIRGHGFSATPAQNSVKFNGAAATVLTATVDTLVATVPAAATTGPITVTVGAQTATSATNFVIDPNAKPPTISNVSPLLAAAGDSITVTGTTFAPVPNQTTVRLGQNFVLPSTLQNASIVFPVTEITGSGNVGVVTPYGSAVSTQDVVVVPPGVATADIASTKRIALDAAASAFSVTTADKSAGVLFDADAGEYLSLQFGAISVASLTYTVYGPDNTVVLSGSVSATSPTVHLPALKASGTYLLLVKPASAPATWNMSIERAKVLGVNGSVLSIATNAAAQQKRLTFTATKGQHLGLGNQRSSGDGWNGPERICHGLRPSRKRCRPKFLFSG